MGIPVWVSRGLPLLGEGAIDAGLAAADEVVVQPVAQDAIPSGPKKGLQAANELIQDLQNTVPNKVAEIASTLDDTPAAKAPRPLVSKAELGTLDWRELQQSVTVCKACSLHQQRQQAVFGRGNTQAQWMIVGDIPRLEDEWEQQPFTGTPGNLLDVMLTSIGLDSQQVYFTNLLKCRPSLNRSPEPDQAASCLSYLQRQIELLQPKLIILMGRDTAQQILGSAEPMARLRQQLHRREGISAPMVVTYHPSYLLLQPRLKAMAWQDLQFAKRAMQ